MVGQKKAVIKSITNILGADLLKTTNAKSVITAIQLKKVRSEILNGILNKEIDYSGDTSDKKKLTRYVNGMIDDHFRKAKELNGGNNYLPKESRKIQDKQLDSLKSLYGKMPEGSAGQKKIEAAIMEREQLLQETKGRFIAHKSAMDSANIKDFSQEKSDVE